MTEGIDEFMNPGLMRPSVQREIDDVAFISRRGREYGLGISGSSVSRDRERFNVPSVPDLKSPELISEDLLAHLDLVHPGMRGPSPAEGHELPDAGLLALEYPLYHAVGEVPYPPRDTAILGHLFNSIPEVDPLDPSGHPDMDPDLRH